MKVEDANPMSQPFGGMLPRYQEGGPLNIETQFFEGLVKGVGGGMDDVVPAIIEGQEPVLLSRDEYVIPADVVSHVGDGSTSRGAELFDEMINNIRRQKTDTTEQPQGLNETPDEIMGFLRKPVKVV